MTDRELLAQAYKAMCYGADLNADRDMRRHWNPLENDGDALRLAVSLKLDIEFMGGDVLVLNVAQGGGDSYANARRAIVRAAAEIARQKSQPLR